METAYRRYQDNLRHASDAGSLYREENKAQAWIQYNVERCLEAAGIALDDERTLEQDFDLLFTWVSTR